VPLVARKRVGHSLSEAEKLSTLATPRDMADQPARVAEGRSHLVGAMKGVFAPPEMSDRGIILFPVRGAAMERLAMVKFFVVIATLRKAIGCLSDW
jgi:hypothetical protein